MITCMKWCDDQSKRRNNMSKLHPSYWDKAGACAICLIPIMAGSWYVIAHAFGQHGFIGKIAVLDEVFGVADNIIGDGGIFAQHFACLLFNAGRRRHQAAARHGALENVKMLLAAGADPTVEGGKYGSAVKAAEFGETRLEARRARRRKKSPLRPLHAARYSCRTVYR